MFVISDILAKQAHERLKEELEFLHAHKEEMTPEQVEQLKSETNYSVARFDNKITVKKEGDDVIMFSRPMTITDNTEQLNGTKYDIASMAIDGYKGLVTVDHGYKIRDIVGEVIGLTKQKSKVTIDGIRFAVKENAEAIFAMNMVLGKFVKDVSIETIGTWPNDDGIYENSKLVGLSLVIVGNNTSATLNSIKQAKDLGLDTNALEKSLHLEKLPVDKKESLPDTKEDMLIRVTNIRNFAITVSFKNDKGEVVEKSLTANSYVDVLETEAEAVTKQINDAVEPKKEEKVDVAAIAKQAAEAATAPLLKKIEELEDKKFDNAAKEPSYKPSNLQISVNGEGKYGEMGYKDRHALQINAAWDFHKRHDNAAGLALRKINEANFEALKTAGKVSNAMTIADMGDFVMSPELITEIEGYRSDFNEILSLVPFQETLSMRMAWLKRSGDIDMQPVEVCDDDNDGNLKPVKEYGANYNFSDLEELAAVTPVCDSATRFLAVDLLGDIAEGYRTDYDRKKAQLLVARLQQAVDETGNKMPYIGTSDLTTVKSWAKMFARVSEKVPNGIAILNDKTRWELVQRALGAGISGPLAGLLMTGDLSPIFGKKYAIAPNELLPSLDSNETKSYVVNGVTVSVNQAVFFFDPRKFAGRISGGLKYDFSTDAAYEIGNKVYSAYQRNELVVRGSFYRGGAIKDTDMVASMFAAGVS